MQDPPAIIGIGRNYAAHAEELGHDRPSAPIVFFKNPASVIGDGEAIVIPHAEHQQPQGVDYEGELALEIARDCRDVTEDDALDLIANYRVANDVSHRWWQREGSGGQYCRGKSFDTFCPLGAPVAASRVSDPQSLRIMTRLNGEVVQDATTAQMLFPIRELVAELSRDMTLKAGTIILTGTPAGVGAAQDPPRFLRPGDTISVEIESIGSLSNPVVAKG